MAASPPLSRHPQRAAMRRPRSCVRRACVEALWHHRLYGRPLARRFRRARGVVGDRRVPLSRRRSSGAGRDGEPRPPSLLPLRRAGDSASASLIAARAGGGQRAGGRQPVRSTTCRWASAPQPKRAAIREPSGRPSGDARNPLLRPRVELCGAASPAGWDHPPWPLRAKGSCGAPPLAPPHRSKRGWRRLAVAGSLASPSLMERPYLCLSWFALRFPGDKDKNGRK